MCLCSLRKIRGGERARVTHGVKGQALLTGPSPARQGNSRRKAREGVARKRTDGVGTNGVSANFMFFYSGTFWTLINLLLYSQKCQGTFCPPICRNGLLLQRPH